MSLATSKTPKKHTPKQKPKLQKGYLKKE